ncbi:MULTISPECIES: RodZ domain-containing protein [unclassified Thioalkalivibrio]|uniref:helix-turn-helix domain-containing protein n=1 Tax=unclassified Thioalkalivibrio TaxID=2621013 RepID=UPI00036740FE|nr:MULTISPECIES: RodZ domain-containing protein [unclassified Thioalkalivibrio]
MVAEPRDDKEPGLGRVEEVDDSVSEMEPLRTTDDDPHATPEFPAASGLTTRDQPPPPDPEGGEGEPGNSLRRAREAAGLDTATLAHRIHLGRGTLEDLEANRFDHMAPAYVRGYLRACARELGVNADPWLRAFEGHGLTDPELRAVATASARSKRRRRSSAPYWLAFLLVLALLGLGVYAWTERGGGTPSFPSLGWLEDDRSAPSEDVAARATDDELSAPPALIEEAQPEPVPETSVAAETDAEASETETERDSAPAMDTLTEPMPTEDTAADETAPEGTASEDTTASSTSGPVSEMALLTGGARAAPDSEEDGVESNGGEAGRDGVYRLVLDVTETSWVEIRNADDEVVFTGVLSSGDREELELTLPGRVVLGNARGVELTLDGESFDFEPHVRSDRTARFDLEP